MGIAAGTELKDPSPFGAGEETEEDQMAFHSPFLLMFNVIHEKYTIRQV